MSSIDFFTFVYKDTYKYAEFLRRNCELLKSGENDINYKCVESIRSDKIPYGFQHVSTTEEYGHNSYNHSIAVNESFNHIKSKYVIIADCDISILYKNWDEIILDELQNNFCFGFSYHDSLPRYANFPNVFLFCFRSDMLGEMELDFRPEIIEGKDAPKRYSIKDPIEAKFMNRKIGFQIKCDTGWKIPLIVRSHGLGGKGMRCVHMNEPNRLLPFRNNKQKRFCMLKPTHMSEWHYKGKLFGTHKQACRSHSIDSKWGRAWVDRIELYLKGE